MYILNNKSDRIPAYVLVQLLRVMNYVGDDHLNNNTHIVYFNINTDNIAICFKLNTEYE